jgi:hypothetical protein
MAEFNDKLASLVSLEMSAGTVGDPAKMSCLIESLASSLAFTVAIAAKGEAKAIDHLLEGIVSYIYTTAAERAPLARMIAAAPPPS